MIHRIYFFLFWTPLEIQADQHVFSGSAGCTAAMAITILVWFDPWFFSFGTSDRSLGESEYLDPFQARSNFVKSFLSSSTFLRVRKERLHVLLVRSILSWWVVQTRLLGLVLLSFVVVCTRFHYPENCHFGIVCRNGNLLCCTVEKCWSTAASSMPAIWGPTFVHLGSDLRQN